MSSFLGRQLLATPAGREEWLVTQRPTGSLRDHLPLYTALPKMFHPKVILLFQRSPGVAPYFIWDLPSAYGIQANDLISFAISRNDVVPRTLTLHSQKRKKGKTERKARRSCHRAALHSCPSTPGYAAALSGRRPAWRRASCGDDARKTLSICLGHEGLRWPWELRLRIGALLTLMLVGRGNRGCGSLLKLV